MFSRVFLIGLILFVSCNVFGQLDELKKAHDTGKQYFDVSNKGSDYFSKTNYVNPFIGTGGHGHTYPGATAPFGMIQLSPDTRHTGWDGCSGYHYSDSIIYGFSHTHLSGTGVSDYGDLLIVPQNGKPRLDPGYERNNGYGDYFKHENEEASPGYYKVELIEGKISVRLTVSTRVGFHEYTFNNPKGKKFILLDLDHRDKLISSTINILDKNTISGSRISEEWAAEQHFYFYMKTDIPHQKARLFQKNGRNKLLLIFPRQTKSINIKVGISAVDTQGAKMNLEKEIPNWNFNFARASVTREWNKELDKIYFRTEDKDVMTNFYTSLYHSFIAPNIFNDVDGRYRGRDNQIHKLKPQEKHYTVFSLWDTYRATHPLYTLTQVERTNQFINTFLRQYDQSGDLPVWELAANETECMIGYHSVSVIADAYTKGIRNYDIDKAVNAMITTSTLDEYGKKGFIDNGYIEAGKEPESVSKTLEYSYDNFCINQVVKDFSGKDNIFMREKSNYLENSMFNFINLFDPKTKFMRARRSGQWFAPFDPSEVNFHYTEANSWQYSLYTPHAVGVLRNLVGGRDSLETWLDRLFTTESSLSGRHQVDITGLIGQYAHGNEPSHHMAYLYNYTNAPQKTQHYVDQILKEMYFNAPDGLSGNEDCGQMSSWYVLSALGIYQIAPGNPYYDIGRPLMDKAIIYLENGNELSINVIKNSINSKYIRELLLNGAIIERNYLTHTELISGGVLEIYMSDQPNLVRNKFNHAPTLSQLPDNMVPVPYFEQTNHVFTDSMNISLSVMNRDECTIVYTTDESKPDMTSKRYKEPFTIKNSTIIKAMAFKDSSQSSVISNKFIKKDNTVSLELKSEYSNQYAAGGDFTLIDGIRGMNEFRTGDWQGYWAQDVVAEVSFTAPRMLHQIGIGCMSDIKSWIFFPSAIQIEVSFDGRNFVSLEELKLPVQTKKDMYPHIKDFLFATNSTVPILKIRVTAKNYGICPDWHLGNGNDTWLFLDEIIFK